MLPIDDYTVKYYAELNRTEKYQALVLYAVLMNLYKPRSITDLGCGTGLYLHPFKTYENDVECRGIELSENALHPQVCVASGSIITADLRENIEFLTKSDVVLCLEVLEHIQEEYADQAVKNIVNAGKILIVSPSPHGGGRHHHNPQPKDYWMDKFRKYGYEEISEKSSYIQECLSKIRHTTWVDNIYVLEKLDG